MANAALTRAESNVTRAPSANGDRRSIWSRVKRDHAMIRALLDEIDRAGTAAALRRRGGLDSFRRAVWDVFIAFDEHLAMEERDVLPLVRVQGASGEARGQFMVAEHIEQRRVLLELVEDTECDTKDVDALVEQARALVTAFRVDMELEELRLETIGA